MKNFKRIISILLIFIAFSSINVFASEKIACEVQSISNEAYSIERAMGLTFMEINIYKNGSTANINIYTQASDTCSEIGFRNGYIQYYSSSSGWQNGGSLGTRYSTNTYFNSSNFTFTMQDNIQYRVIVDHYCIINGTTYYQQQISNVFSK